ncbi:MAG: GNAT family N-acetyltransferase [Pseudomonadota bacterium]
MRVRDAGSEDAPAMSALLMRLKALKLRTSPGDEAFVLDRYISRPERIRCSLAEIESGRPLGFQILSWALEGNPYGVTPGWAIIGTHVAPEAARRGVGRALFAETLAAARAAGVASIDATIGEDNAAGLAYYEAMGFRAYRTSPGSICKRFDLA